MKSLKLTMVGIAVVLLAHRGYSQSATPAQLLEQAVVALESSHDYGCKEFSDPLRQLLAAFPASAQAPTAKVLLATSDLSSVQAGIDSEVTQLCDQVVQALPGSWQCGLALSNKISLLNFQEKLDDQLQCALTALARTDLSPPNNVSDPIFRRVVTAVGGSSSASFLDSFHASACLVYLEKRQINLAQSQAALVTDAPLKAELQAKIAAATP